MQVQTTIDMINWNTPTMPAAGRGAVCEGSIKETTDQLDAGLVWWPCSFCGKKVLVDSKSRGREKCSCGAVRCHYRGQEGWCKDGDEWWFI